MRRLTIILILLILIPLSVEALYVNDEQGNRKTCLDISEGSWAYRDWHNYVIGYEHPVAALNPLPEDSYVVVDSTGYPKPMYVEKGISQYGYNKDYTATEYRDRMDQLKEELKLTEPSGKWLYGTPTWVPFPRDVAANDMAYQQFYYEHFVPDDACIPCTNRGLTEYYGECITCAERSEYFPVFGYDPDQVVQGKKGYYGCFPCPDGTKWDGKQCADPTTEATVTPTPTTTVPPTKTTTPTSTPLPTTLPPKTSLPTTTPPKKTVSPTTTAVPPQTTTPPDKPDELGPYDEDKGYCGPNNLYAYSGHIITKGIGDFGRACYNHDICYSSSGVSRKECDQLFLTDMGDDCLNKSGLKGFTCFAASQVAYAGVRFVGWAFYEPWSGFF